MLPLRDATPPRRTPVITLAIIAACTGAFIYELWVLVGGGVDALDALLFDWGAVPADVVAALQAGDVASQAVAGLVTSMFLHGGWLHLLGNMLFLWIFANRVEDRMGRIVFPIFYLVGGLAAGMTHVLVDPTSDVPAVGASGAISAVMGAYVVLYPRARIQSLVFLGFFYQLIAVPSVIVLGFWFALQLIDGFASLGAATEAGGGVAWFAHIGGFVAGAALALPFRLVGRLRPAAPATLAATGTDAPEALAAGADAGAAARATRPHAPAAARTRALTGTRGIIGAWPETAPPRSRWSSRACASTCGPDATCSSSRRWARVASCRSGSGRGRPRPSRCACRASRPSAR